MVDIFLVVENFFLLFFSFHKILCIVLGDTLLETRQVRELTSKDRKADGFEQSDAHFLLQIAENSRSTDPLAILLVGCRLEVVEEELFGSSLHTEPTIPLLNLLGLCRAEVVGLMLVQCSHGLGVKLFVVGRGTHVDRSCELHTQETTAARGICQHIRLIP